MRLNTIPANQRRNDVFVIRFAVSGFRLMNFIEFAFATMNITQMVDQVCTYPDKNVVTQVPKVGDLPCDCSYRLRGRSGRKSSTESGL